MSLTLAEQKARSIVIAHPDTCSTIKKHIQETVYFVPSASFLSAQSMKPLH